MDWDSLSTQPPGIGGSTAPNTDAVAKLVQDRVNARQSADAAWNSLSAAPPAPNLQTQGDGSHLTATKEGLWDRVKDVASDAFQHSPGGALARSVAGAIPSTEDYSGTGDNSQAALAARANDRVVQAERDRRAAYEGATADDPWRRPDGTRLGNAARFGADALGMIAGGAAGDPTNLLAPGESLLGKMLGQAAIGGGVDAATQGAEMAQGVRDQFDPLQTGVSAAGGAALVGGHHLLERLIHGRPAVPDVSADQLVDGALDGAAGGTPALPAPERPVALLPQPWDPRRALPDFSSDGSVIIGDNGQPRLPPPAPINPDAIQMASPQAFRARQTTLPDGEVPIQLPDGAPRLPAPPALLEDMRGQPAPAANSNRPVPTGTPNGAVTPDVIAGQPDQGAQDAIAQIAARLRQAMEQQAPQPSPRADLLSSTAPPPRPANADLHRITMMSESRGDDAAVSPVGAKGRMQVMDGTNTDPGFGVRKAADGSLEERARVGRDYFDAMMQRYGGDPAKAWGAYNWGPGHMDATLAAHGADWLDHVPAETRAYVEKNVSQLGPEQAPIAPPEAPVSRRAAPVQADAPTPTETRLDQPVSESQQLAAGPHEETPAPEGSVPDAPTQPSRAPQPPAIRERAGPTDALTWLADRGGLRDDEGHDLRGTMSLQRPIPGAGSLIRKNGMSIDDAGELLHEAGWFPNHGDTRPTEAEVLDFLERAGREKVYHQNDWDALHDRQHQQANEDHIQRYRQDLEPVAAEYGHDLTDHEIGAMGVIMRDEGRSAHDAFLTHQEREFGDTVADASREQANPVYEGPDHSSEPGYERAQADAYREGQSRAAEPERLGGDEGPAPQDAPRDGAGGSEGAPEQLDGFGRQPGDERAALERRADGRQRADVAQKPPGSDGGLFDTRGKNLDLIDALDDVISKGGANADHAARLQDRLLEEERAKSDAATPSNDGARERPSDRALRDLNAASDALTTHYGTGRLDAPEPPKRGTAERKAWDAEGERLQAELDRAQARFDDASREDRPHDLQFRSREGASRTRPRTRQLAEDLRHMASVGSNTHARRLAAHLADLVGDAEVHYGEKLPEDVHGVAGITADGKVGAAIAREGDQEALLHEAIHVSTLSRYGLLKKGATEGKAVDPHVNELERLRARAAKAFARRNADPSGKIEHALSNTDEFLAGGLTSREVQQFLQRHSAANLWGRFVDGVRNILGLKPHYDNLLDRVLQHGAGILKDMPKDATMRPEERVQLFSKGKAAGAPVDAERPGEAGWKRIGGLVFEKDFDGSGIVDAVKGVFGDPKGAAKSVANRMRQFGEVTAYSADSTLRSIAGRFEAPSIAKLADLFHAEAGKASGTGRTYQEAVTLNTGRFGKDLNEALKPHLENDAAMNRIRDLLATPDRSMRATAQEREAAGKVRDLLKEVLEYRRDAGEDIGEVGDGYFPRRVRADKVAADPEGFRDQATKLYRSMGVEDPAGAADAFMLRIMDSHAGISDGLQLAGSSSTSSAKAREFGKAADSLLKDFYETNPLRALSDYVTGSVRRAEQTRRFGPVGRLGSAEREAWVSKHGADATQWGVMKDAIKGELRAKGADATNIMERIDGIRQTNLGMMRPGSMKTGAVVSTIHAWNQLGTLANSTFASLPEMAMGFVRGGPRYGFTHLATTFSEFARNVRKLPASDARRYAEAIGSVGSDTAMDLLRARADDPSQNVAMQKLLHQFYRKNGLEQWTDAGRTAAVKTGQKFVNALAHDMMSTDARTKTRAAGYLRELGVKDAEGFGQAVRDGAPTIDDLRGDKGFAGQYATALLRFADQSVLMPTRAVKPSWASHPLGSLLFALQSYNYAFKKNVLDRAGRLAIEGVKERDPAKLAPAAGLIVLTGTTALVQGLRHIWDGQPAGADQESGWHYALETIDRAGMFGAASPLLNAFEGLRYRRSVGSVLQGAVIGRAAQAADALGGLAVGNNPDTNTAERKAAGAVYDMAVKPAIDAIGAGVLRGPLGSAAILGSGKKPGAVLPSDKEAFTSALAGPDETDE